MGEVIAIVAIIFSNITFVVIALVWWRNRHRKMELQAEVQNKLLERFSSAPELAEFLQSPAGREFVNGVRLGAGPSTRDRALTGIRRAVLLIFLGLAFWAMWGVFGDDEWAVPTVLLLALGVGHVVAVLITVNMARRLGIDDDAVRKA